MVKVDLDAFDEAMTRLNEAGMHSARATLIEARREIIESREALASLANPGGVIPLPASDGDVVRGNKLEERFLVIERRLDHMLDRMNQAIVAQQDLGNQFTLLTDFVDGLNARLVTAEHETRGLGWAVDRLRVGVAAYRHHAERERCSLEEMAKQMAQPLPIRPPASQQNVGQEAAAAARRSPDVRAPDAKEEYRPPNPHFPLRPRRAD